MKKQYFAPKVEQMMVSTGCLMDGSPVPPKDPFGFPSTEPGANAPGRKTILSSNGKVF